MSVVVPGWNTAALVNAADVLGDLKVAEGTTSLGMRLALWDPLAVEVRHLLYQVVILQQDRTVWSYGECVFVAGYGNPGVVRRGLRAVAHIVNS